MLDSTLSPTSAPPALKPTALDHLHRELGARMVGFAGYDMPLCYPKGILAEHLHTRAAAGLFDVSHMGQALLEGPDAARRLESLVPGDIQSLAPGHTRYTQLLDRDGHILDDLFVTRREDQGATARLFIVVNAGTKTTDFAHITSSLSDLTLTPLADRALLALQGPKAAGVLARHIPEVGAMPFMSWRHIKTGPFDLFVSRSGYTGEDGFEISIANEKAAAFAGALLADPEVRPIGLGARDSLRLEAGLCLYGHDIDVTTDPIEAGLGGSISKRRKRDGGFPGAERLRQALEKGSPRKRVGLLIDGKALAREGTDIATPEGRLVGRVTSGGFSPSLERPIAMGYVAAEYARPGQHLHLIVRGNPLAATIATMPFVPHRYYRGT